MSTPFIRFWNNSELHFESYDEFDAWVARNSPAVIPSWMIVEECQDCGEELKEGESDYCVICVEDRNAMYGDEEGYFIDRGPVDSDPYDKEPWPI